MGLFSYLFEDKDGNIVDITDALISLKANELATKEFAMEKAINMIANSFAKCEMQIYKYDLKTKLVSQTKNSTYYSLNIRPNANENATTFWKDVIRKLFTEMEALVIVENDQLLLADSFSISTEVLFPRRFTDVVVDGYPFGRSFSMKDVFYFSLGDSDLSKVISNFYSDYGTMLAFAKTDYKLKNKSLFKLKLPQGTAKIKTNTETGEKELTAQEYANMLAKKLFDEETIGILGLPSNVELEKLLGGEIKTSQDYRDMLKGAMDFMAMAFGIPLDIFYGNKTDKSTSINDYIAFAIAPLIELFEDELNSKLVTNAEYLLGSKIRIDQTKIQYFNILDVAEKAEALYRIGFTHNELRSFGGLEKVDEKWADERHVTSNYITNQLEKGGGKK